METENELIVSHLTSLFNALLVPTLKNSDNVFFEKLITHLSAKENTFVLQEPMVGEWVKKCLDMIEVDFKSVDQKVISFMLKLCAVLASNEWIIINLKQCKVIDRIWYIIETNTKQFNPGLKLATINMLSAIAQYTFGSVYIKMKKAWRILLDYCNNDHTVYVVREARQLLYDLLYIFSVKARDEELLIEMLGEILKPLTENAYEELNGRIHINVEDGEMQHELSSTLDLISYIFQKTLESKERTNLIQLCNTHHNLELNIWKIFETALNPEFTGKILIALSSINFALLLYNNWEASQIPPENFNYFGLLFFNQIKMSLSRDDCINFLKLTQLYHVLWKSLGQRAPKVIQIENERVCFENQLIAFHILPLLYTLKSKEIQKDELFDDFVEKLFSISCEQTQRLCYACRDVLYYIEERSTSLIANLACKSIHSMLSLENKLEREHAVLVFKAMIYPLQELVLQISDYGTSTSTRYNNYSLDTIQNILYNVLVGLKTLIERYHISWKESIETIGLINCVGWLLESSNLPVRLSVQALKLVQSSIEHFLSPNMALLVNNLQGSGLVRLGPMIVKRVHDNSWDVRDSVVELVSSIAKISRNKFPAFQQFLADHNICPVIYEMAKHDSEPYVRASAFQCLTNFVTINLIWENELKKFDILEHLFYVLLNEPEGIVRKEAVITLSKIYDYRKIPSQYNDTFYLTLAHCTVADLYWEVKVNALQFWKLEVQRQFTHQGMIDGTFPTVTFSKEHKKIVTLTEKEINLRIIKAFNELSQRGCLGIILKCLTEECDLEVIKATVCIVQGLFKMLEKYDYESALESSQPSEHITQFTQTLPLRIEDLIDLEEMEMPAVSTISLSNSDTVINEILNIHDINLLANVYEQRLQVNETVPVKIDELFFKQFTEVSAKTFISNVKAMDLEQLLKKNEWNLSDQSFLSLLEDILCAVNPETDSLLSVSDCY